MESVGTLNFVVFFFFSFCIISEHPEREFGMYMR